MTSYVCTEESRDTELPSLEGNGKDIMSVIFMETSSNGLDNEEVNEQTKSLPTIDPEESNVKNQYRYMSRSKQYWKKKLICFFLVIIVFMSIVTGLIAWILMEFAKMKAHKAVMLYRPTGEYLENVERGETIQWRLVKEHSQQPFSQINATHIHVNEDGFFHISCSLLMQTNSQNINVITLLIFYANEEKSIYTKKSLPKYFSRFTLQYSIVLHLQKGAYFYVQVIPSKYILKDPNGSYLSITHV